jgi:ABC-type antimicrobial peptide transport system permease subunit
MALGATRANIGLLIVRAAFTQIGVGLLLGIPLALVAARALQSQLFGVSAFSVAPLAIAAFVVGICALLASALPARRAATIAPMAALRTD